MSDGPRVQLFVVRGFEVRVDGAPMRLPTNVARVLAYLALQRRPQRRAAVAAALWMDVPDTRASANLRTALWQARRLLAGFVLADATRIALHESVHVDLWAAVEQASRLGRDGEPLHSDDTDADLLGGELLPEWDEEWIVAERERFRLLRMHALETLSRKLTAAGCAADAVDAALVAVAADPLRESAVRALLVAHRAQGNVVEAHRQFVRFRQLLVEEIGVEPSDDLARLAGVDLMSPGPTGASGRTALA